MAIPIALTVAGSDSSGGAGIQADLKTLSALGVYGASVITSLTAQNTLAVTAVHDLPASFVAAQLCAVFSDLAIDAVKVGMLSQAEIIRTTAARLRENRVTRLVLDPVMISKSGAVLLQPGAVATLREELIPLARVLTPNLPEAAVLLGVTEEEVRGDLPAACARLLGLGPQAVVLKGGHMGGAVSEDLYYDGASLVRLPAPRLMTRHTHGTGCTFSAAITAGLARGLSPLSAVRSAKRYISGAIQGAEQLAVGHGQGPVHHFFELWAADQQDPGESVKD